MPLKPSNSRISNVARQLRRQSTFPERRLWSRLRAGRLDGTKFRRQHPLGPSVLDFHCHADRLAVEVDGLSHVGRRVDDLARTAALRSEGIAVMRVTNDDVLEDVDMVAEAILRNVRERLSETPEPSPRPSPGGRGGKA